METYNLIVDDEGNIIEGSDLDEFLTMEVKEEIDTSDELQGHNRPPKRRRKISTTSRNGLCVICSVPINKKKKQTWIDIDDTFTSISDCRVYEIINHVLDQDDLQYVFEMTTMCLKCYKLIEKYDEIETSLRNLEKKKLQVKEKIVGSFMSASVNNKEVVKVYKKTEAFWDEQTFLDYDKQQSDNEKASSDDLRKGSSSLVTLHNSWVKCPVCFAYFSDATRLSDHFSNCHQACDFINCEICHEELRGIDSYLSHMRYVHANEDGSSLPKENPHIKSSNKELSKVTKEEPLLRSFDEDLSTNSNHVTKKSPTQQIIVGISSMCKQNSQIQQTNKDVGLKSKQKSQLQQIIKDASHNSKQLQQINDNIALKSNLITVVKEEKQEVIANLQQNNPDNPNKKTADCVEDTSLVTTKNKSSNFTLSQAEDHSETPKKSKLDVSLNKEQDQLDMTDVLNNINKYLVSADKYKCPACCETLRTENSFKTHVKIVHLEQSDHMLLDEKALVEWITLSNLENKEEKKPKKYKCKFCNQEYASSSSRRAHLFRKHYNKKEFQCPNCEKSYNMKTDFECHVSYYHPKVAWELKKKGVINVVHERVACPYCKRVYSMASKMRYHVKTCHKDKDLPQLEKLKCTECFKSFNSQSKLALHTASHKPDETDSKKSEEEQIDDDVQSSSKCDFCEEEFPTKLRLDQHVLSSHFNVPLLAEDKTEINNGLKNTLLASSPKVSPELVNKKSDEKFIHKCPHCSESFNLHIALKKHISNCSVLAKNSNSSIPTSSVDQSTLNKSIKTISSETPYEYYSGKSDNDDENEYYEINSDQEDLLSDSCRQTCEICSKTFLTVTKWNNHVRSEHSMTKDYFNLAPRSKRSNCPICKKSMLYRSLFTHISEMHTNEILYPCNICQAKFTQRTELKAHKKQTHSC